MAVANTRHQARTIALQVLYESDIGSHSPEEVLTRYLDDVTVAQPVRRYVERLVTGFAGQRERIDEEIGLAATAFPVDQLPAVDRNILRIAIYELMSEADVPLKAAINEAVELAKRFGGDNSSRFVNGVLGTIAEGMIASRG
jgi:N utilization substance protein B